MSEYVVTARKWRPMKFDEVAAQHHVTATLKNAIALKRIAHAYLFAGPRGVGKTTTARLLAKAVNCTNPVDLEPDNTCEICIEITEGKSFDVLEIDAASNRGVDEIRNLREAVRYAPTKARYKVYIIDEVHMLTKEAFNALLKTLEEPPPHVMFIFATTEIHKIPQTILSRCQRFDFRRISIDEITANLKEIADKEGISIDEDALLLVAKKGDGSLRDAQSIFDQIVSLCGKVITRDAILEALNVVDQDLFFRVTDLVLARDARGGVELVQDVMYRGYDIKEFLSGLVEHLRNILTVVSTGSTAHIESSEPYKKRYATISQSFSLADILRMIRLVNGTETAIRWSAQPRFKLEADILQLIAMHPAREVAEVLREIDELKKKISANPSARNEYRPAQAVADSGTVRPIDRESTNPSSSHSVAPRPRYSRQSAKSEPKNDPGSSTPMQTSSNGKALSEGEVISRWSEFVDLVKKDRISLSSNLQSARLNEIRGNVINVTCTDRFDVDTINRSRAKLSQLLEEMFHIPARIDAVIGSGKNEKDDSDISPAKVEKSLDDHPIVRALKRELGAEPI